jgi:hypothetical protein
MSKSAIEFYAKKYFPFLLPEYGQRIIVMLWEAHQKQTEQKP